ncbi:hypothetical protein B0J11DRAFT_257748 [Dendryphion nanum]|uniref:Uncharacterized protein n=1 Tax=Dendryphion nanum TaxID=256645 RepID=A0A9P9IRL6_9PLEO|nr:hypothetical protein B0J11DRAFT_257748 [Dendryphion nanum]
MASARLCNWLWLVAYICIPSLNMHILAVVPEFNWSIPPAPRTRFALLPTKVENHRLLLLLQALVIPGRTGLPMVTVSGFCFSAPIHGPTKPLSQHRSLALEVLSSHVRSCMNGSCLIWAFLAALLFIAHSSRDAVGSDPGVWVRLINWVGVSQRRMLRRCLRHRFMEVLLVL